MTDDITKELAEIVEGFRWFADMGEPVNRGFLTRVDAALELYAEPFMTPEKPKMTINLKDYEGKLVVATLRNELMLVGLVNISEKYHNIPYVIDDRHYTNDGKCFVPAEREHDIIDIKLVDEDPEPVITRVEVITDTGREYVNWEKDNKITTSLQDEGRTLKVFVNTKNTEESEMPITKPNSYEVMPSEKKSVYNLTKEPEMPITKPEFYDNLPPGDKTRYNVAEKEVSKQWATALTNFIAELGGDSPALWEWKGITPTPEKVVEYLRKHIKYLLQLAADEELKACIEWVSIELNCTDQEHLVPYLREYRRPKPTLKSQALRDFETVRKHSDELALLPPEILDTIENALQSIPE